MTPFHIPLSYRKSLLTKIIFIEAANRHRSAFPPNGHPGPLDQLEADVRAIAFEATKDGGDGAQPRLDTFVREAFGLIRPSELYSSSVEEQQQAQLIIKACRVEAAKLSCDNCVTGDRVCSGKTSDDISVTMGGACIRPIREMFSAVIGAADLYYRRYGTLYRTMNSANTPEVYLSTANTIGVPHTFPASLYVSGMTSFRDSDEKRQSVVTLRICVNSFDWDTHCAIPYVLFHECICHAYQNLLPLKHRRPNLEPDDPFGEGWMDWIAYRVLEHFVKAHPTRIKNVEDVLRSATAFHEARMQHHNALAPRGYESASSCAAWYVYGKEAAKRLECLFRRLPESSKRPEEALFRFSFDVNVLGLDLVDRKKLVTILNGYLPDCERWSSSAALEVMFAFRKYLQKNDLTLLLDYLLQLKPKPSRRPPP